MLKINNIQSKLRFLFNKQSNLQPVFFILIFACLGVITIILSRANGIGLTTSNKPNDVIIQYSLPHIERAINRAHLQTPVYAPFTLYGNGLLICGHSTVQNPFIVDTDSGTPNLSYRTPTSVVLPPDLIRLLVSKINSVGYFKLNHEYFKHPVSEKQDILRVSLLSGDHYVLYYNDLPPPKAYTETLLALQKYCKVAVKPYKPASLVLRTLKNAALGTNPLISSSLLNTSTSPIFKKSFADADSASNASIFTQAEGTSSPHETNVVLNNQNADTIFQDMKNTPQRYVSNNGIIYETEMDVIPPKINNPLKIDYRAIRAKPTDNSIVNKTKNLLNPKAYASGGSIPIRAVILLPSDGSGNTNSMSEAANVGLAVHDWYCGQVGACYGWQGVQVIVGSQTQAFYNTCHAQWCQGDPLGSVLNNVYDHDRGTIYLDNIDTVVIPGWPTGEMSKGVCGWGLTGNNLAAVDYTEPTISSGSQSFCQPGHDMAHELGHTFGLQHTGNGTLMDGAPYASFAPLCDMGNPLEAPCNLDSGQAAFLTAQTQFFPSSYVKHTNINFVTTPISNVSVSFSNDSFCTPNPAISTPKIVFDCTGDKIALINIFPPAGWEICPCSQVQAGNNIPLNGGSQFGGTLTFQQKPPPPPPPPNPHTPIYEYFNGADYLLTVSDPAKRGTGGEPALGTYNSAGFEGVGPVLEGYIGTAYIPGSQTVRISRLYNANGIHFYTSNDIAYKNAINSGYHVENYSIGYVPITFFTGSCPAGSKPLTQAYNPTTGGYFYSSNPAALPIAYNGGYTTQINEECVYPS